MQKGRPQEKIKPMTPAKASFVRFALRRLPGTPKTWDPRDWESSDQFLYIWPTLHLFFLIVNGFFLQTKSVSQTDGLAKSFGHFGVPGQLRFRPPLSRRGRGGRRGRRRCGHLEKWHDPKTSLFFWKDWKDAFCYMNLWTMKYDISKNIGLNYRRSFFWRNADGSTLQKGMEHFTESLQKITFSGYYSCRPTAYIILYLYFPTRLPFTLICCCLGFTPPILLSRHNMRPWPWNQFLHAAFQEPKGFHLHCEMTWEMANMFSSTKVFCFTTAPVLVLPQQPWPLGPGLWVAFKLQGYHPDVAQSPWQQKLWEAQIVLHTFRKKDWNSSEISVLSIAMFSPVDVGI